MRFIQRALIALGLSASAFATASDLTGAGSTFVYPILSKWAATYKTESGQAVNYQSIGSGGGIKQIEAKTVDFGATDMPLKSDELEKNNLVQFPVINGAIVPVVNVPGVKPGAIKLSGEVLAKVFLGTIKKWNDPAITKLNAGVALPEKDISVVHRSDGSGTSFIFTNYLSKVSADWKSKVGEGTAVNWPIGVGGKGNEGVASYVKQIEGSIGYVEYAYASSNNMTYTQVQNKAGKFVEPNGESFAAAAAGADWAKTKDFYLIMTDSPGAKSWPIAGSTFILMQKDQKGKEAGKDVLKFIKWAYAKGEAAAKELHYVPLPKKTVEMIEKTWSSSFKGI